WLTLQPEGEVVLDDFWQNKTQVEQVLTGCYRSLTEYGTIERMMVWGELRSDNVTPGDAMPFAMNRIMNFDINASNEYNSWGSFYSTINYCNNFLHYAPGVVDLDENFTANQLRSMEAEVLTIRSLCYFYLVRTFEEVPWVDVPSIDDSQDYTVGKASEDSVLTLVVSDLKTALLGARDKFEVAQYNKGRINKNTVRALLADIALWQEDYAACAAYCDQIDPEEYELQISEMMLTSVFYFGNSPESIFELQFDDDDMTNGAVVDLLGSSSNPLAEWSFPLELATGTDSPFGFKAGASIESEEDVRFKDFLYPLGMAADAEQYFPFKYVGYRTENAAGTFSSYYHRSTTANWIVYRYSDIILMKAEALVELDKNKEALALVNQTYLRSNTTRELEGDSLLLTNYPSKRDMQELVLRERQREFMFEGKRYFDLMRLARREQSTSTLLNYVSKVRMSTTFQTDKLTVMKALYLPISKGELDANSKLVQNSFYALEDDGTITK
ncbi:MAG: RagB/SusD family nutrient uptake outer membrane protein, partial [Bacteroidales bacterium]|nr:RagB/SusD family nutrient uptake outer membrane protein [Bacteroidales bacterium]